LKRYNDSSSCSNTYLLACVSQDDDLADNIKALKFLVLDEADRMIETGHFAELENILKLTLRESRSVAFKIEGLIKAE
jgi:superfamily II DNA/RNA helicase